MPDIEDVSDSWVSLLENWPVWRSSGPDWSAVVMLSIDGTVYDWLAQTGGETARGFRLTLASSQLAAEAALSANWNRTGTETRKHRSGR